jgi:glycosyltransferase involved in cell wall biosynthesis
VRFVANGVRVPERTDRRVLRDRLGLAPDRRIVGFLGRLAPEKGPDLFVDMAARLVPDHADVHVALFGGGPDLAATRVGGVGTLVADGLTGRLVPRGDAAATARAVAALLADPATAARYGAAGRVRVAQQFTLERMRAAVAAVYAETEARARARRRAGACS